VQITPSGLNISSDLSFLSNNALNMRSVRFSAQSSLFSLAADVGCIYVKDDDLYYRDLLGNNVRITQSGAVAGTPGSISNLVAPASATYVSGSSTFVWQSNTLTPANLDAASVVLRNLTASSNGLTLSPPAAMGSDFSIVLPSLPAQDSWLQIDNSGNITAAVPVVGGLDTNNLSPTAGIVGGQIADDVALGGTAATLGNANLVTSVAQGGTYPLQILRGTIDPTGGAAVGEGYTSSRASLGTYNISYAVGFADTPAIVATAATQTLICQVVSAGSNSAQIRIFTPGGVNQDSTFHFIMVGIRA
jgi:hypothetical protein